MNTKLLLLISCFLGFTAFSQTAEQKQKMADSIMALYKSGKMDDMIREANSFTSWKSKQDFFTNKVNSKYYCDDCSAGGNGKFVLKDSKTKSKKSFNIYDSLFFGYQFLGKKNVWFTPAKDYASFCGGTEKTYVVIYPMMDFLAYDADGYASTGTATTMSEFTHFDWFIVVDSDSKEKNKDIEKLLSEYPDLLRDYQDELAKMSKKEKINNELAMVIRYVKKYNKMK